MRDRRGNSRRVLSMCKMRLLYFTGRRPEAAVIKVAGARDMDCPPPLLPPPGLRRSIAVASTRPTDGWRPASARMAVVAMCATALRHPEAVGRSYKARSTQPATPCCRARPAVKPPVDPCVPRTLSDGLQAEHGPPSSRPLTPPTLAQVYSGTGHGPGAIARGGPLEV